MARRGSKLGTSVLDLDVDDSKFNSQLDKSKRRAQSWTAGLGKQVKQGIGMGLGVGGGLLVAQGVSAAIGMVADVVSGSISKAIEWESAFAGVRKTVDASEEEFGALEAGIRGMSKEIPIAATELAGLAEAAGALGIAKEDILEFTRVTALIGTTTDVSADQAATSLGQLSNVLGLTSDDYERFGSTLVDLGNKGASTESQILEIASRAGAGSKLIGMASAETLAWASAVANLGIEVEAGGSSLQTFFLKSAKAVADGTEKLETYARVAGMTGAEFKTAFEKDATGALQTFIEGLGSLTQGEQLQALADLDFNDVRITRTLLGLAGNVDNLGNSLTVANEAWEENSALSEEAAKRFGTTESKLQILGNRMDDLAVTFGDTLLPALVDLATFGVEQVEAFVREINHLVDSFADSGRWLEVHFGHFGKTIEDRANEIGVDVVEMKDTVVYAMNELGMESEAAVRYAERVMLGLPPVFSEAAQESVAAWKERDLAGTMQGDTQAGVDGTEAALLEGAGPIGAAAEGTLGSIDEEARKAREASIEAMKTMLDAITGLFDAEEDLPAAWQALIDRMNDPYTEAERRADIFSQTTIDNIRSALKSGDPAIAGDAAILVSNMLAQIETMEPGALAAGDAVPPAIRAGMDAQMSALITWIETNVTGESLASMSLEEAKELGLDGIWLYAQGMRQNQKEARDAAAAAAAAARAKLPINAYEYGKNTMLTYGAGIRDYAWSPEYEANVAANAVSGIIGVESEPKDPSSGLHGITKWGGNLVETYAEGMMGSLGAAEAAAMALSHALAPDPLGGLSMPYVAGVGGLEAGLGGELASARVAGGGARTIENHYHLHVDGREVKVGNQQEVLDAWRIERRFSDRSLIRR